MNIGEFYNRLRTEIFVDHTTYNWKNGWQNEGNRKSKSLTIVNQIDGYNLFLLTKSDNYDSSKNIEIEGPNSLKIEIRYEESGNSYSNNDKKEIRIDIEYKPSIDIYYHVDNETDWEAQESFLYDLCKEIYESNVKIKEKMNTVPNNLYGTRNPNFVKLFHRDIQLKKLGL
jgi:hypothetical protein